MNGAYYYIPIFFFEKAGDNKIEKKESLTEVQHGTHDNVAGSV
jgi:hypothetical protein